MNAETAEAQLQQLALETYRKIRIGLPHMPEEDSLEGRRKIAQLLGILRRHVATPRRKA